jgi:hypothetical protein
VVAGLSVEAGEDRNWTALKNPAGIDDGISP